MPRRILQVTTSALVGLAVVFGLYFLTPRSIVEWDGASAPPEPYPAPELVMPDLDGRMVDLASFDDRTTVVFFGFTHCPDVCPSTLLNLTRVLDDLPASRSERLQVVFVTVDPERDTPERLGEWMANFHPSILALRASEEDMLATAREWGVHVSRGPASDRPGPDHDPHDLHDHPGSERAEAVEMPASPAGPGEYGVDHTGRSFVVDERGRVVLLLAPFQSAGSMERDLRRVLR